MGEIAVLRLGHRIERDKRLTTHVGLTARAFGASVMYFSGDMDSSVINSIKDVVGRWGGQFTVIHVGDWRGLVRRWLESDGVVVHLTMYGTPLVDVIDELRRLWRDRKILTVIGGEKVDPDIYSLASYNISITTQPHSEVAALAVFLDWLHQGEEMKRTFNNAKIRVIPSPRGKKVIKGTD